MEILITANNGGYEQSVLVKSGNTGLEPFRFGISRVIVRDSEIVVIFCDMVAGILMGEWEAEVGRMCVPLKTPLRDLEVHLKREVFEEHALATHVAKGFGVSHEFALQSFPPHKKPK